MNRTRSSINQWRKRRRKKKKSKKKYKKISNFREFSRIFAKFAKIRENARIFGKLFVGGTVVGISIYMSALFAFLGSLKTLCKCICTKCIHAFMHMKKNCVLTMNVDSNSISELYISTYLGNIPRASENQICPPPPPPPHITHTHIFYFLPVS